MWAASRLGSHFNSSMTSRCNMASVIIAVVICCSSACLSFREQAELELTMQTKRHILSMLPAWGCEGNTKGKLPEVEQDSLSVAAHGRTICPLGDRHVQREQSDYKNHNLGN